MDQRCSTRHIRECWRDGVLDWNPWFYPSVFERRRAEEARAGTRQIWRNVESERGSQRRRQKADLFHCQCQKSISKNWFFLFKNKNNDNSRVCVWLYSMPTIMV